MGLELSPLEKIVDHVVGVMFQGPSTLGTPGISHSIAHFSRLIFFNRYYNGSIVFQRPIFSAPF